jgi:hypothetical protein
MKFLFLLLSCFMLYLTCLPCSDSIECNAKPSAEISAADNHQQHNHSREGCSPFCTCSCCAVSAFYSIVTKTQISKIDLLAEKHPLYNIGVNTEVYYAIWQPPKIS